MSDTFEGERICYIEPFDAESSTIEYREEVVRCGDCKHHKTGDAGSYCCKSITTLYNPDGFCAWGERRDV